METEKTLLNAHGAFEEIREEFKNLCKQMKMKAQFTRNFGILL